MNKSSYTLNVRHAFSAAHHLRNYEGRCARSHGHNYAVEVAVIATSLDENGLAMDYYDIKKVLDDIILQVDHYNLNDLAPFTEINPTAENIAAWFYNQLKEKIKQHKIQSVTIYETEDFWVRYSEDE